MAPRYAIPATCPPLLAALIQQEGGLKQAAVKAGADKGNFGLIARNERGMTEATIKKITAVLKTQPAAAQFDIPPFVPWNGKKVSVKAAAKGGGGKVETLKGVPEPIALLITKFGGSRAKASEAVGFSGAGWIKNILDGDREFSEKTQAKVHAALYDLKIVSDDIGDQLDKFTLKIAICLVTAAEFARVEEIAEIFGGEIAFKKSTGAGWVVVYKIDSRERLEKFKRIAKRDAKEITCP